MAIWDVRKLGRGAKPLARAAHGRTCQSAFWAPDGVPLPLPLNTSTPQSNTEDRFTCVRTGKEKEHARQLLTACFARHCGCFPHAGDGAVSQLGK
jgi:hypothetical protein